MNNTMLAMGSGDPTPRLVRATTPETGTPRGVPGDFTPPAPAGNGSQHGFANVVGRLVRGNAAILVAGIIAGPVAARTLGVAGRGDVAAITVALTVGPWLLDLGLSIWLAGERARGGSREELLGAALPAAFAFSLIAVAAAIPVSHLLGRGRPVVTQFVEIGLFLMPVSVLLQTLAGVAIGEARWSLVIAARVVSTLLPAVAIVVLSVLGRLTVSTAAATYLIGPVVGALLLLRVVTGMRRLVLSGRRTASALRFGVKSWLSTLAGTGNTWLDQLLMAALVPSRELGLYVVAVTVASVTSGLIGAVSIAQFPRIAGGDSAIAARSSRVTMGLTACGGLVMALLSRWLIPSVFGRAFADAVPIVVVLLFASVPLAGSAVLSLALSAAGNPGAAMRAELVALAFTIPTLVLFLPAYGALLAAAVSLVAYSIRLGMQLRPARQTFSTSCRTFLLPTRADLIWLKEQLPRNRLNEVALARDPRHEREEIRWCCAKRDCRADNVGRKPGIPGCTMGAAAARSGA